MGGMEEHKPVMAMIGIQFAYAGLALFTRIALLQGMSPRVFVVYRQAMATIILAPTAYISRRRKPSRCSLGLRSFSLIFLASLIGVTINQNIYFEGLYLASSSTASAMANLIPAITFVMASFAGMEKISMESLRSMAKILGTVLCVSGAISMALLRGPKLLNMEVIHKTSAFGLGGENWLLGCLFLFGSACCWSFWLILQVPISECYPDSLSFSAWMCSFSTILSGIVTLFFDQDLEAWILHSNVEIACCLYAGIIGSGICFFVQAWCISKRGPVYSAMFNPLCTVIVTTIASIFLHEEIYTGGLAGAFAVIIGLYVVLWGKARDLDEIKGQKDPKLRNDQSGMVKVSMDEYLDKINCKSDLEQPFLSDKSTKVDLC
ncbi:WAT1-related protein At4g30420-like isoform X2 [Malania oleifera]|uniref:WAT1-related protein At4g30420-like isoform X2 n=1 Tax=Malania oleifera TaxID=397392 RepID=UPI0025ADA0F1|nr:WAT1-related protein At4g30420-like isoform X2 [Malania oleifera]